MEFGLMFFASSGGGAGRDRYRLLLEAARFADVHGFRAVWTPERHFHEFGGLYPNPAISSAALALATAAMEIRAGSLVSPLHDSLRIAEEWSMVDNLSGGRVAISFGSGWNIDDFVFFPERYESRQRVMYEQIETVRRLWRGEALRVRNSNGREVEVRIFPRPVQPELPVWITSSGNIETFASAGAMGAHLLTHLIGQDLDTLAVKIRRYRESREQHGLDPAAGRVALMLHTHLGADPAAVAARVRGPFREYLRSAVSLERLAWEGGGAISGGHRLDPHDIPPAVLEDLLDLACERYSRSAALIGTPESCTGLLWHLEEIGVQEVACLVDFLADEEAVLDSLPFLDELRAAFSCERTGGARTRLAAAFVEEIDD